MKHKNATINDIAQLAGTSIGTVSLALRGSTRISAETKKRVREAAEKLDYQTSFVGSLLSTAHPKILGLLCYLSQESHINYRTRIIEKAEAQGFYVVTENMDGQDNPMDAIRKLNQFRCQALIVIDPGTVRGIDADRLDVPTVTIGQSPCFATSDVVTSNNEVGMYQICEHLKTLGHTNVIYVDGPAGLSATVRRQAFEKHARTFGLKYLVVAGGAEIDSGFSAVSDLISSNQLSVAQNSNEVSAFPTAFICYNDLCAEGAIIALLQNGYAIPENFSVVGFDNSACAKTRALDLTSVERQVEIVAQNAVQLAIDHAQRASKKLPSGGEYTPQVIEVDTFLVPRGSTSQARKRLNNTTNKR